MKLSRFVIKKFRNVLDSTEVDAEPSVTCLVGKNESGKTAILHALYRLNPARPNVAFDVQSQYPAWLQKKDQLSGIDLKRVEPVTAFFSLDQSDLTCAEELFGPGVVDPDLEIAVSRSYGGELQHDFQVDESEVVAARLAAAKLPDGTKTAAGKVKGLSDFAELVAYLRSQEDKPERLEAADRLQDLVKAADGGGIESMVDRFVNQRMPTFIYFAEYASLPYSVDINRVLRANGSELDDEELTARGFLRLAAADDDYLTNPDYERRKRELENVANAVTADVLKYWSQNDSLRVQPDISQKTETTPQGTTTVLDELKIRIWDDRHFLSLPFDEHSTGFQWFFSFLVAFSEYEHSGEPIVLLLDEPALGLHARAQGDFLRFIEERLTTRCQVLYSTHSPFMIEPDRLERVRMVQDRGQADGSQVSKDVSKTDEDTLFPLQGALGYDLVQHLFIAPNNLVVEGTSDYTYLVVLSDFLADNGREGLDERWSVVPVGGVDLVPTFVALLGNHLDLTVLVDAKKGGHQKLNRLVKEGLLEGKRIVTPATVLKVPSADIEDLFTVDDYLALYNAAFSKKWTPGDLTGTDPIVKQIARKEGIDRFHHGKPADQLLRTRDTVLPALSSGTLDNFEELIKVVNATLPAQQPGQSGGDK